uniref:t-SNARE coiled-coil homology domain-containing protein n=1 Tax=Fibrocapsa japonica TaxID=94617 RepID=A0A7S2V0G4_9STRA
MFGTRAGGGAAASSGYSKLPYDEGSDDDNDYIRNHVRRQQKQLAQQDEHLEELGTAVERLGDMSLKIGDEIADQNKLISAIDNDLADASDRLDMITRKTKELVAKSGGTKWFILIVVLSIILFVLLLLVLYT